MTIPKSLVAKFAAAGGAKRASAAQRERGEAVSAPREWKGRRALRREAREAANAAEAIWAWLDSDDAHALYALGHRAGVRVMLSGGIPPVARHAIALGEEPGTLWVLRLGGNGSGSATVRSARELVERVPPDILLSLARALETGEVFDRIARGVEGAQLNSPGSSNSR